MQNLTLVSRAILEAISERKVDIILMKSRTG